MSHYLPLILCAMVITCVIITYWFLPLPFFSYLQGEMETDEGTVTGIKEIRPGLMEISLKMGLEIDPQLQHGNVRMVNASTTRFFHCRKHRSIPAVGNRISLDSLNRYHRFTGRSLNWIEQWRPLKKDVAASSAGKVKLVTV